MGDQWAGGEAAGCCPSTVSDEPLRDLSGFHTCERSELSGVASGVVEGMMLDGASLSRATMHETGSHQRWEPEQVYMEAIEPTLT